MVRSSTRIETGTKRVRIMVGGNVIADTTRPLLVWEKPFYPTYYIPLADIAEGVTVPSGTTRDSKTLGRGTLLTVKAAGREMTDGAVRYEDSPLSRIRDHIRFDWNAMDAWFEEDEEVFVHPRDPYSRIDILNSSRHIRVEVNGETLAETHRPALLFETGLPVRYYIPKVDVRMDLLTPTSTITHCPYKGAAEYWAVTAGGERLADLAWSYRSPVPESMKIAGLISFYNEKADIYVDGVLEERPRTQFSKT